MSEMRVCKVCSVEKIITEFVVNHGGRLRTCKACHNKRIRSTWNARYKTDEAFRASVLKRQNDHRRNKYWSDEEYRKEAIRKANEYEKKRYQADEEYRKKRIKTCNQRIKKRRETNEEYRNQQLLKQRTHIQSLPDSYIKNLLEIRKGCPVPNEVIEVKRLTLRIKYLLKGKQ